jgi:eukaryotic-like serine/threonine-protein kinase
MRNLFLLFVLFTTSFGCQKEKKTTNEPSLILPTLTTTLATSIASTSTVSGGNISSDGGDSVTARGVCWGTLLNPTILQSHTTDGTGVGVFTSTLTGLLQNTTYHVRAYASNSVGTAYGNDLSFTTLTPTIGGTIYIGGISDGKLYALDANSGNIRWTFQTGGSITNSATIIGNLVIFGSNDRNLYAVNINTGLMYWKFYTGAFGIGDNIEVAPAVNLNTVYFSCSNGKLYAIDTTTQTIGGIVFPNQKWVSINGGGRGSGPTIDNGLVFASGTDKTISAFDAQTGIRKWQYHLDDFSTFSNAVVLNNTVYVFAQNSFLYALNETTGNLVWKTLIAPGFTGSIYGSPTIWNGTLYVPSPSNSNALTNQICAIDISTGAIKWFSASPGESGNIVFGPVVYNGILYGTSDHAMLYAWDATTGALKWKFSASNTAIYSSPNIANDLVYFAGENGTIYAVDAANGTLKWQKKVTTGTDKIINSSPCIIDLNGVIHHPGDSGEQQ